MHSTKTLVPTPVVEVSNTTQWKEVKTPQRKANRKNKARFKLKDLKQKVLKCYNAKSKQIKRYVLELGYQLDLRMTTAWEAIWFELKPELDKMLNIEQEQDEEISPTTKKIIPSIPWRKPPVFDNDFDAMTWYINENNPQQTKSA